MAIKHTTVVTAGEPTGGAEVGGNQWNADHTIEDGTVTLAKMADMATSSVIYRKTAGTGIPEVQTLATLQTDLGLTGTNSNLYVTIADVNVLANYSLCFPAEYEVGSGFITDLASAAILEIC